MPISNEAAMIGTLGIDAFPLEVGGRDAILQGAKEMDLPQLRAFVEVARLGNLTRAANTLFLSQPALSSRIRSLEEEIGVQLFERNVKGMLLTAQGSQLYSEARRTLEAARDFIVRAKKITSSVQGTVRLGTISEPVALRLGEFLSAMLVEYPDVVVSLTQGISGSIVDHILAGDLDAGYVIGRVEDPRLVCTELIDVRFRVAAPLAWREAVNRASWQDLGQYPWVGAPDKCSYNAIMRAAFRREGIEPRRVAEADQENMIRDLVRRGLGLSILREDQALAAEANGELVLWPHGDLHSVLCFVQPIDTSLNPINSAMLDMVSRVWDDVPVYAANRLPTSLVAVTPFRTA